MGTNAHCLSVNIGELHMEAGRSAKLTKIFESTTDLSANSEAPQSEPK
ncbi:MAG: hypothetical protein VYA34_00465 [Myxococcota bacterium]|nr:hypothetical protein [Myxococcota bacterium]